MVPGLVLLRRRLKTKHVAKNVVEDKTNMHDVRMMEMTSIEGSHGKSRGAPSKGNTSCNVNLSV